MALLLLTCPQNEGPYPKEYQKWANWLQSMAPDAGNQAHNCQGQKASGHHNLGARDSIYCQAVSSCGHCPHLPRILDMRPDPLRRWTAHLGLCLHGEPGSPSNLDQGGAHHLGLWQSPCGSSTASTPHTCQLHLFIVPLLHSTTEPVSSNKCPVSPSHVRAEIRQWREICKQRRPT